MPALPLHISSSFSYICRAVHFEVKHTQGVRLPDVGGPELQQHHAAGPEDVCREREAEDPQPLAQSHQGGRYGLALVNESRPYRTL